MFLSTGTLRRRWGYLSFTSPGRLAPLAPRGVFNFRDGRGDLGWVLYNVDTPVITGNPNSGASLVLDVSRCERHVDLNRFASFHQSAGDPGRHASRIPSVLPAMHTTGRTRDASACPSGLFSHGCATPFPDPSHKGEWKAHVAAPSLSRRSDPALASAQQRLQLGAARHQLDHFQRLRREASKFTRAAVARRLGRPRSDRPRSRGEAIWSPYRHEST